MERYILCGIPPIDALSILVVPFGPLVCLGWLVRLPLCFVRGESIQFRFHVFQHTAARHHVLVLQFVLLRPLISDSICDTINWLSPNIMSLLIPRDLALMRPKIIPWYSHTIIPSSSSRLPFPWASVLPSA